MCLITTRRRKKKGFLHFCLEIRREGKKKREVYNDCVSQFFNLMAHIITKVIHFFFFFFFFLTRTKISLIQALLVEEGR
jgi:hypothetical protein